MRRLRRQLAEQRRLAGGGKQQVLALLRQGTLLFTPPVGLARLVGNYGNSTHRALHIEVNKL